MVGTEYSFLWMEVQKSDKKTKKGHKIYMLKKEDYFFTVIIDYY